MDDVPIRAVPFRESSISTGRSVPKCGTGDDLKEDVVHFFKIRLKLALNVDYESGCDCREQTSLFPSPGNVRFTKSSRFARKNAHKDQCAIKIFVVFLDKVTVVIVGCALKFFIELDGGVAGRPKMARKESRQCFKHNILQAEDNRNRGWKRLKAEEGRSIRRTLLGRQLLPPLRATRCGCARWAMENGK